MARASFPRRDFERQMQREFRSRGRQALAIYRQSKLKRDRAGYPFEQRPEDGSIRDPRAASIRRIPNGVRIAVQARGAPFIERGNDAGGQYIQGNLILPLRGSESVARRRVRAPGRVVIVNGRPVLAVQRVRTYRGRRLLERAIAATFTSSRNARRNIPQRGR